MQRHHTQQHIREQKLSCSMPMQFEPMSHVLRCAVMLQRLLSDQGIRSCSTGSIHVTHMPESWHRVSCRFMLITPLHSARWDKPVLVNRGWVPSTWRSDAKFRQQWETSADVTLEAVTRVNEDPSSFVPQNNPKTGEWFWIDIPAMATALSLPPDTPLVEVSHHLLYLLCMSI